MHGERQAGSRTEPLDGGLYAPDGERRGFRRRVRLYCASDVVHRDRGDHRLAEFLPFLTEHFQFHFVVILRGRQSSSRADTNITSTY